MDGGRLVVYRIMIIMIIMMIFMMIIMPGTRCSKIVEALKDYILNSRTRTAMG